MPGRHALVTAHQPELRDGEVLGRAPEALKTTLCLVRRGSRHTSAVGGTLTGSPARREEWHRSHASWQDASGSLRQPGDAASGNGCHGHEEVALGRWAWACPDPSLSPGTEEALASCASGARRSRDSPAVRAAAGSHRGPAGPAPAHLVLDDRPPSSTRRDGMVANALADSPRAGHRSSSPGRPICAAASARDHRPQRRAAVRDGVAPRSSPDPASPSSAWLHRGGGAAPAGVGAQLPPLPRPSRSAVLMHPSPSLDAVSYRYARRGPALRRDRPLSRRVSGGWRGRTEREQQDLTVRQAQRPPPAPRARLRRKWRRRRARSVACNWPAGSPSGSIARSSRAACAPNEFGPRNLGMSGVVLRQAVNAALADVEPRQSKGRTVRPGRLPAKAPRAGVGPNGRTPCWSSTGRRLARICMASRSCGV